MCCTQFYRIPSYSIMYWPSHWTQLNSAHHSLWTSLFPLIWQSYLVKQVRVLFRTFSSFPDTALFILSKHPYCTLRRLLLKPAILLSDVLFILGTTLLAAADSEGILLFGRIIIGLGVGVASKVVLVYLSETAPTPIRGRIITMYQLIIVIGGFLSYLICYLLNKSWRVMFGMATIPAFIQLVGMLSMTESPRWYLKYNREEEAMNTFG